jgi:3-isopropylmalate/(R)-2-methylmalate dehydratase small subunit
MMQPFRKHTGLVAPLDRANVDTDQIIPKQFLKRIERTGFGQFAFYDWRFAPDGTLNTEFTLNNPRYKAASVLVAGKNFGCGSSREHAPWALADYGFKAIIAPTFADIFYNNSLKNGLLLAKLSETEVAELLKRASGHEGYQLMVDLEQCRVSDSIGFVAPFEMEPFRRRCLLEGLDDIGLTLRFAQQITDYEQQQFGSAAQV